MMCCCSAAGVFTCLRSRAGATRNIEALVDELCRRSAEFAAMWRDNDVRIHGEGTKQLRHPVAGVIALEYSAFAVDGRPDLSMVIYTPATPADAERIISLVKPYAFPSIIRRHARPSSLGFAINHAC